MIRLTAGSLVCCVMAVAGLVSARPAIGGQVPFVVSGGSFTVPIDSIKETRFRSIVRQQYDYSCGSAALASLLTHHYEIPKTEQEVFKQMWEHGNQEAIMRLGFSMFDMKQYLASIGIEADGYRVPLDKLASTGVPAITLINTNGYKHFVIIKGIRGEDVLVGDPALGVNAVSRAKFEEMWEGVVFVIREKVEVARRHFNAAEDWSVHGKAPFSTVMQRSGLGAFLISLPRPGDL